MYWGEGRRGEGRCLDLSLEKTHLYLVLKLQRSFVVSSWTPGTRWVYKELQYLWLCWNLHVMLDISIKRTATTSCMWPGKPWFSPGNYLTGRVAGGEGVGTVRDGDNWSSVYQSCHEQFLDGHTKPFHPILLQLHIHLISTRMRVVGFFQWKFQCMCTRVDEFTSFIHSRYNVQSFRQGQMHHLKHSFCLASKDVYNFQMDLFIE